MQTGNRISAAACSKVALGFKCFLLVVLTEEQQHHQTQGNEQLRSAVTISTCNTKHPIDCP
jgi:hypothetical protein